MDTLLQKKLLDEIFTVTRAIQKTHPELYKNLNETPLFISGNGVHKVDFEKYLESLKLQLSVFENAGPNKSQF